MFIFFSNSCIRLLYSVTLTGFFFFSRRSPEHTCRAAASLSPSSAKGMLMYVTQCYSPLCSSKLHYGNFQKSDIQIYWQETTISLIFECSISNTIQKSSLESCTESELSLSIQVNTYNSDHPSCTLLQVVFKFRLPDNR